MLLKEIVPYHCSLVYHAITDSCIIQENISYRYSCLYHTIVFDYHTIVVAII